MRNQNIWHTFLNYFNVLFEGLPKFKYVFKSSTPIQQTALLSSVFVYGGGLVFQKQYFKGFVHIFIQFIFLLYLVNFGMSNLLGQNNLPFLNMQVTAAILIALYIYMHLISLSKVVQNAQDILDGHYIKKSLIVRKIKDAYLGIKTYSIEYKQAFSHKKNRLPLIISLVCVGLPQMVQMQFIKGLTLFILQVVFVFYMIAMGFRDFIGLFTLNVENVKSDFSLVYGIIAVFALLAFLSLYIASLKNVKNNALLLSNNEKIRGIKDDIKAFFDEKFYITSLTIPILGTMAFTILPLLFMVLIAFTNYSSGIHGVIPTDINKLSWIGFGAFKELLFLNENLFTFLTVLVWTLIWAVVATFTCYFGGIFLALLINKKIVKCKTLWRTLFIISMAMPQFVSLLIMKNMFDIYGPINSFLAQTSIGKIDFWNDQTLSRILIILVNMWIGIPYTMVYSSGILQNIPNELYESAYLEGSTRFHAFKKITMPYLFFMTAPILITSVVSNINNFNVIFLLTGGAPFGVGLQYAGGTDILITWLYKLTMQNRLYNMGAAIGIIMFIVSATLSLMLYRKTSSYNGEGDFS